jgi:hypothetical protein
MRSVVVITLVAFLVLIGPQLTLSRDYSEVSDSKVLEPGDKGYMHEQYHEFYKKLYAEGRCYCRVGQCRASTYRMNSLSPSGIDVKIDGGWYNLPLGVEQPKHSVPPELWLEEAHVCAYPKQSGGYEIECAIINAGT